MGVEALLIGSMATTAVGTAVAYKGAKKAGKQQQQAHEFNAKIAERNARVARKTAEIKKHQTNVDLLAFDKEFMSFQKANAQQYRANGFVASSGTPLRVMLENAYEAEKEKSIVKYNSAVAQAQLEETAIQGGMDADLSRMYGQQARTAGKYQAYSSLLSGASNMATMGFQGQQAGVFS